ncbi:MAG: pitrilysin family protein [Patescibacteria group bacterium]
MHFKKKTLSSGVRVVMVPMPQSLTTTVLVLTETGSKYEEKRINGISHFLEHLCFKGTEKRPGAKAISEELDGLGASYNAFTSHEYTGYYAKTESSLFEKALDVVSDIYLQPTFPKEEIEKERGVIIGEIEMYEDNPQREVWDLFTDVLYGNQPAGWNVAGTRESVARIQRKDIASYHKKHYVAEATIIVVAGKYNEENALQSIQKAFSRVSESRKHGKKKTTESQKKPAILLKHKKTSQTHLVLGFRSYGVNHPANQSLDVLAAVLGGGMSSRLFSRIRDEMGAGYYVGASNEELTDHGYFSIYTGVKNDRVVEVLRAILDEVRRVRDGAVSDTELTKVKNYLIGNLFSGLETSNSLAMFYGIAEATGMPLKTPEERAEKIRKTRAHDIMRVAGDILKNNRMNLALIGPFKDKKNFTDVLSL